MTALAQLQGRVTQKRRQKKLDAITENRDRLEWFGLVIPETRDAFTTWHYANSTNAT